jgi:hypothetical protein
MRAWLHFWLVLTFFRLKTVLWLVLTIMRARRDLWLVLTVIELKSALWLVLTIMRALKFNHFWWEPRSKKSSPETIVTFDTSYLHDYPLNRLFFFAPTCVSCSLLLVHTIGLGATSDQEQIFHFCQGILKTRDINTRGKSLQSSLGYNRNGKLIVLCAPVGPSPAVAHGWGLYQKSGGHPTRYE